MSLESCIVRILLSAIPLDDPQRHIHLARSLAMPLVICDISVDPFCDNMPGNLSLVIRI
jgi:hypothetical protein